MFDQQGSKKSLQVIVEKVEFAKDFHYFITTEVEGDNIKRRTDVSEQVNNPIFATNKFFLPLHEQRLQKHPTLIFQAFVVGNRNEQLSDQELYGAAKLLGTATVEITPLLPELLDVYGLGIRRKLEFRRSRDGSAPEANAPIVGRATCTLKLVGDYLTKFDNEIENIPGAPKRATGELHVLPSELPNFAWRVRCDVRSAENMPLQDVVNQGLPSCFLEFGWSLSDLSSQATQAQLQSNDTEQTVMAEKTANPNWNQQVLFHNPKNVLDSSSGYFIIQIKDFYRDSPIDQLNIPMKALRPFQPIHLEIYAPHRENPTQRYKVFISLNLEKPFTANEDELVSVVVNSARFQPQQLKNIAAFSFVLANNNFALGSFPSLQINPRDPVKALEDVFRFHNELEFITYQSPWLHIPPSSMDNQYSGLAVFVVPKSYLNTQMRLYTMFKDTTRPNESSLPDEIYGSTSVLDQVLKQSLGHQNHPPGAASVNMKPVQGQAVNLNLRDAKINLELSCHPLDDPKKQRQNLQNNKQFPPANELERGLETYLEAGQISSQNPADQQKWQLLARELAQKQEIIHRMMRENDDKTQSLKLATSEVIDLRRSIKMMQSENSILRKQMAGEEASQLQNLVAKEIASMSNEELKHKVIKLAQAYRSERIRNEYFEKALKSANVDLVQTKRVTTELENVKNQYDKLRNNFSQINKEMQKIGLYKDTIRKQENVIVKLEALLDKTLKETQRAREGILELEKLKTENLDLQTQLKNESLGLGEDPELVDQLKKTIEEHEQTIEDLKNELENQRPQSAGIADWEDEKIGLELEIEQKDARVYALEEEQVASATTFAMEIANLKNDVVQYKAQYDNN